MGGTLFNSLQVTSSLSLLRVGRHVLFLAGNTDSAQGGRSLESDSGERMTAGLKPSCFCFQRRVGTAMCFKWGPSAHGPGHSGCDVWECPTVQECPPSCPVVHTRCVLGGCPCGPGTAPKVCVLSSLIVSLLQLDGIGNFTDGETGAQGALDG